MRSRAAIIVSLALVVTACASSAERGASTPSASAATAQPRTATPSPEPTPIDVVGELVDGLARITEMRADISGEVRAGDQVGEVSGETSIKDRDHHLLMRMTFPDGSETEVEELVLSGVKYERDGSQWIRHTRGQADVDAAEGDGTSLDALLAATLANPDNLELDGYERVGSDRLQRIASTSDLSLTPTMFGLPAEGIANFDAEIAFLAEDDGTPSGWIVEGSWEQSAEGATLPLEFRLAYRFQSLEDIILKLPDNIWQVHTSDPLGYRLRHPVSWTVEHDATDLTNPVDIYYAPVDESVQVFRIPVEQDVGAALWFRSVADELMAYRGVEPTVAADISLGGGLSARVFTLEVEEEGVRYFHQLASLYAGSQAWDVVWYSSPGSETEDTATFMEILVTFEPIS